jgi:type 1 glutamine amidotransferase
MSLRISEHMLRRTVKLMNTMNIALSGKLFFTGILVCGMAGLPSPAQAAPKKVLVVTVTTGFRHSSIPTAEKVLAELGKESRAFTVEYARVEPNDEQFKGPDGKPDKEKVGAAIKAVLAEKMSPAALKHYDAIIFANTTGDLPLPDNQAFLDWIKSGKGFVGMHSATDTFHGFQPYIEMIGAEFKTHGAQVKVDAINQDQECPACKHLPANWEVFDEIYQFKNFDRTKVHGLLTLDKHPNNKTPGDYPISWCKGYGGNLTEVPENGAALLMQKNWHRKPGRVFYTSLGHREDVWDPKWPDRKNPKEVAEAYQAHILGGIKWALGLQKCSARPQMGGCCQPGK